MVLRFMQTTKRMGVSNEARPGFMKYTEDTRDAAEALLAAWRTDYGRGWKNRQLAGFYARLREEDGKQAPERFMSKAYARERIAREVARLERERDELEGRPTQPAPERRKPREEGPPVFTLEPSACKQDVVRKSGLRARILALLAEEGATFDEVREKFGLSAHNAYQNIRRLNYVHGHGVLTCADGKIRVIDNRRKWLEESRKANK